MSVIYIAGPYRADTRDGIERNIQAARQVAIAVWQAGHTAMTPHLNTAHFGDDAGLAEERYLAGDLDLLSRCDAVVLTPDWERSSGARAERAYAEQLGMPISVYPAIPPLHPTEVRCPAQVQAFRETVMRIYRVHLEKNADYAPANILGTGEIGLITRLWDKMARLMNLSGFRLHVHTTVYETPRTPKHESVDDTLLDLVCYGVIGILLRQDVWGR